jgi:pimeloyl-ACP methyl ester carboxylesterase
MKRRILGWGVAIGVLLSLLLVLGCSQPMEPDIALQEKAVSVDDLRTDLDSLGAVRSKALFSASSIPKTTGGYFTAEELAAYLSGIKDDLASYVSTVTSGSPCLVRAVRLRSGGQSGLMWVPVSLGRTLSVPIIAYHHGTQVYWKNAPSLYDSNPLSILYSKDVAGAFQNYVECVAGALMACAGYIVVMPDYPGFGDSRAPHPYVHLSLGESTYAMIQKAKSTLKYMLASARHNGRIYLIGYSEGGFATMAAAKTLQGKSVAVTAAVPCAGSYDLAGTMVDEVLSGEEALVPYHIPYTVHGYASVYRSVEPAAWEYSALLKPPLPSILDTLFSGNRSGAEVSAAMPSNVLRNLITDSLAGQLKTETGAVYGRLLENTAFRTGWNPNMLVQMVHCPADDIVPVENTLAAKSAWSLLPNVLEPIYVAPVPLPDELSSLADIHLRAYPTALLAGFTFIGVVESGL